MSRNCGCRGSILGRIVWAEVRKFLVLLERRRRVQLFLGNNHVVLFELAVQGGLADAKNPGSGDLVSIGFAQRAQDGAAFEFLERSDFVFLGLPLDSGMMKTRGQIRGMDHFSRT